MDAPTILAYGHRHVLDAIDGLEAAAWTVPEVTTAWSVKDVVGHLAAHELVLAEALAEVLDPAAPTSTLDAMRGSGATFNDEQAAARAGRPPEEVLAEYEAAHRRVTDLVARLTPERLRENGTIPWYGDDYSLDDLVVYANYAHKREHAAQIRLFRKRTGR